MNKEIKIYIRKNEWTAVEKIAIMDCIRQIFPKDKPFPNKPKKSLWEKIINK